MKDLIISYLDGTIETQSFEQHEKQRYEAEEYNCAMQYLDDLKIPRTDETPCEYSLVGRIQWLVDHVNFTGMDIRVGKNFDYYDTPDSEPCPCKIVSIHNNGFYVVYGFRHLGSTAIGSTIYPKKFKHIEK